MEAFRIRNIITNLWYNGSGNWTQNEQDGKLFKKRRHATSSLSLCYGSFSYYKEFYLFELVKYKMIVDSTTIL